TGIGRETVTDLDEIVRVDIEEGPGLELVRVYPVVERLKMARVGPEARPECFQKGHPTARLRSLHHDRECCLPAKVEWLELLSKSYEGVVRRDQLQLIRLDVQVGRGQDDRGNGQEQRCPQHQTRPAHDPGRPGL